MNFTTIIKEIAQSNQKTLKKNLKKTFHVASAVKGMNQKFWMRYSFLQLLTLLKRAIQKPEYSRYMMMGMKVKKYPLLSLSESISTITIIEKFLNKPITKFYNSDDVNVIAAEIRFTKTRPTFFHKKYNLL